MAKRDPNAPAKAPPPKKTVHVLVLELYHFPKVEDDWSGDLVAATPLLAVGGTPEDGDYLRVEAHRRARLQAEKYCEGKPTDHLATVVKECRTSAPNEYRVWIESGNANQGRFVWVVREVEFK